MLPLSDSAKTQRTPWVNLTLILINVVVFLYELSLGPRLGSFIDRWAVVPAQVTAVLQHAPGAHPAALLTLVTAMFLHGGWLHIGGNMLFLWIFGDNVEDRLGHGRYLGFYFACGIVANLAQVAMDPLSSVGAIGASGAIAGVLGAYAITYPGARISVLLPVFFLFTLLDVPALIMIGVWFAIQFFSGVATLGAASMQSGGVAWWAHVGGFLFGILLMIVLPKDPPPFDRRLVSADRRLRDDTGLIGLLVGTISLASHVAQLALLARLVVVFLGAQLVGSIVPVVLPLIRYTNPVVQPFARFIPVLVIDGHWLELPSIAALCAIYLIGTALISIVAAMVGRRARW